MRSGDGFVLDIVAHRAQEATAIARRTEEAEEERGDGRLTIRPRDTDDLHRLRGVAVECRTGEPERLSRRADDDISDVRTLLLGERLDEDGTCTRLDSGGDEAMPISMDTAQGDEERPRLHGTGVFGDMGDLTARDECGVGG